MQFDSGCVFHHHVLKLVLHFKATGYYKFDILTCGKKHFRLPFLPGFEQMLLDPKCTFGLWNVNMLFWMRPKKF